MNDYEIFIDASCDVLPSYCKEHQISILPMKVFIGEKEIQIQDMAHSNVKDFYQELRKGALPKTSQITPYEFEEYFTPILKQGKSILYLALSSQLSATYDSACIASQKLNEKFKNAKVYPFDSLGATVSIAILLEEAVNNREKGMSIKENIQDLLSFRNQIFTGGYIDNLFHLTRGGRLNKSSALLGTMLGLKPIVCLTKEGKLEKYAMERGVHKALNRLLKYYEERADRLSSHSVYIVDADNDKSATILVNSIKDLNPTAMIKRLIISPIIGTHTGPESVVLGFKTKE